MLGYTPLADTPSLGRHPLGRHPQGRHPLFGYYGIRSTSGRYASYWNAYFLIFFVVEDIGPIFGATDTPGSPHFSLVCIVACAQWIPENHLLTSGHWWGSNVPLAYSLWQDRRSTEWAMPAGLSFETWLTLYCHNLGDVSCTTTRINFGCSDASTMFIFVCE